MEEYSKVDARAYIAEKFAAQGDFNILPKDVFGKMLDAVMDLDESFMAETNKLLEQVVGYLMRMDSHLEEMNKEAST